MADLDPSRLEEIYGEGAGYNPNGMFTGGRAGRSLRVFGGHITKNLAEAPALPTVLYDLADKGVRWQLGQAISLAHGRAPNNINDVTVLPGVEGAKEWTDKVEKNALSMGESVAGETLTPGLLNNTDLAQQVGTALGLLVSPLPIAGALPKIVKGLKEFDAGIKAINFIKNAAINSTAVVSPVIPTKHVASFMGANAAIGGGLTVAAETLAGTGTSPTIEQGDQVSPQATDKFKLDSAQGMKAVEDFLKMASDSATSGVVQAKDGTDEVDRFLKFVQQEQPSSAEDEDSWRNTAIAIGTGIVGVGLAWKLHKAKTGVMTRAYGGESLSTKAMSGVDGYNTRPDASALSASDIAVTQGTDASHGLTTLSKNPESIRAKFEAVTADPNGRLESVMMDGSLGGDSALKFRVSGKQLQDKVTSLEPDAAKLLDDALINGAEIDNRIRAWRKGSDNAASSQLASDDPAVISSYKHWLSTTKASSPKRTPENIEKQFSFHKSNTSFDELENTIKLAKQDPRIADILDDVKDVNRKLIAYRVEQGDKLPNEASALLRERPSYAALPVEGSHMAHLDLTRAGGMEVPGSAIRQIFPYMHQTFKEVANGKLKTAFLTEQNELAKSGNKISQGIMGKFVDPASVNQHNRDKIVLYRDVTGKQVAQEINEPTVRELLKSDAGSGAVRMTEGLVKWAAAPSRALEWATTGPASSATGSPFAVANWMYGTGITTINRPVGTVAGYLDKIVQDTVGSGKLKFLDPTGNWSGKFGLRADPTWIAQSAMQIGENVTAVLSKYGAMALENITKNHNIHSPGVGASTLEAAGKALSNYYKSTMIHEMEKHGLRGGATPMYQQRATTLDDLEKRMSPAARGSRGWAITRDFIHDIFGAVGNAPQAAFYKHNKGRMSDEMLVTRTRNIMGDPSKSGLAKSGFGKGVAGAIVVSPWGGVTVQSIARFSKSIKENPLGTATAIFGTVGLPAYMISAWNMRAGPEYLEQQYLNRSPDESATEFYIAIPGRPANEGVRIRMDALLRPFKILAETVIGHNLGLFDGSVYKPENEYIKNAIDASLSDKYGYWGQNMKAALGQIVPAIPPIVNAGAIQLGMGSVGRSYIEPSTKISENKSAGATDSTSRHTDNTLFGYNISAEMDAMISALGGQLGRGIYETLVGIEQGKKDGLSGPETRSDTFDRFGQRISLANREIAGIWNYASVISPSQEATSVALRPKIESLKKLEAASELFRSLSGSGGELTGGRKREIEAIIGTKPVQFKDQSIATLAYDAQVFMRKYNELISGNLRDQYRQIGSVRSSALLTPASKTKALNNITEKIVNYNREGMGLIKQWEWGMSRAYGRDINIDKIKLDEGIDQFPESK